MTLTPEPTRPMPPAPVSPAVGFTPPHDTAGEQDAPPPPEDTRLGLSVTHRRYVPYSHAHYAGHLVDGAYALGLFGDVATEVCIRTDGDEGLFASYSDVQFQAPMKAGDVLEVTAQVLRVGRRSRELSFTCVVVCRGRPDRSGSAAEVLDPPLVAVTARGTVVVP
jgi:3-aminobutyryl-CoA ammonia-lyase